MKTMRYMPATLLLAFALSASTLAGNIHTGIEPEPAPAVAQGDISTPVNGDMHNGVAGDMHTTGATAEGLLAGAVVDLVRGVLSLL
ncbi:MAG TPA: hypothetical protein VF668_06930 [Pyrinomonadaceae bacterium]|jgi:hypothetical protein